VIRIVLIFIIIGSGNILLAQDIHFTQFDKSPLMLNPSLTGNFDGDWRYVVNQRSQWRSVSRSYNTIAISVENKQEQLLPNLYYGVNYINDVAGDGDYRTHELNVSATYNLYLSKDSSQRLTPSIQIGMNHKSIDFEAFKYDLQFNGFKYDENLPSNEAFLQERYSNFNLAFGLGFFKKFKKKGQVEAGFSIFNIVNKKETFMGNFTIKRDRRIAFHSKLIYPINFEWDVLPGLLYLNQGKYQELDLGANIRYVLKKNKGEFIAPYVGLWFRSKDAINIVAGMYYNNWIAGISYDVNISELSPASNIRGGLEFSFQYIVSIFKPENIQYRICPDYL